MLCEHQSTTRESYNNSHRNLGDEAIFIQHALGGCYVYFGVRRTAKFADK